MKSVRWRAWNWRPPLDKTCAVDGNAYTCGRECASGHAAFESFSLDRPAAHPAKVAEVLALALVKQGGVDNTTTAVLAATRLSRDGKVRRHLLRGQTEASSRELREQEDKESRAGMRNAADLVKCWPKLWKAMRPVAQCIRSFLRSTPSLTDLAMACGDEPTALPPAKETVAMLRQLLEENLEVEAGAFELHHEASPWRYRLVKRIQCLTKDPDIALAEWLEHGAPMGLNRPIERGYLFPPASEDAEISLRELDGIDRCWRNHPSFEELHGAEAPPCTRSDCGTSGRRVWQAVC